MRTSVPTPHQGVAETSRSRGPLTPMATSNHAYARRSDAGAEAYRRSAQMPVTRLPTPRPSMNTATTRDVSSTRVAEHGAEQTHPYHLIDEPLRPERRRGRGSRERAGKDDALPRPRVHARTRLRTAWLERQSEPNLHGAILTRRRETVVRAALLGVDGQVLLVEQVERLANEVEGDAATEWNPLLQTQVRLVLRRLDVIVPRNDGAVPVQARTASGANDALVAPAITLRIPAPK